MEALIAFLFDNLYLVIVVMVFLFSMLGRIGKGGPVSRMPDFGAPGRLPRTEQGGGVRGRIERPEFRRESPADFPAPSVETSSGPDHHREPVYASEPAQSASTPDWNPLIENADRTERPLNNTIRPRVQTAAAVHRSVRSPARPAIRQEDLRQAIIWSEILGPPRALKGRRRAGR